MAVPAFVGAVVNVSVATPTDVRPPAGEVWAVAPTIPPGDTQVEVRLTDGVNSCVVSGDASGNTNDSYFTATGRIIISNSVWLRFSVVSGAARYCAYSGVKLQ